MNGNNFVKVYTSLPPSIKRIDPYYILNFHLNYVKFTTKSTISYENVTARVIWWGEEGGGAFFHPRIVNLAGHKQSVSSHARYHVSVPINHFSTYLSDMDKLYIDFIDQNKQIVIGRAFVEDLKQLGLNKSSKSLCNILNENNVKIGEVLVTMSLEPGFAVPENISDKEINTFKKIRNEKNVKENKEKFIIETPSSDIVSKLRGSIERIDKSHDLIDDLIEKGKKLRETIAINVQNDEINNDIARKTFPNLEIQEYVGNQYNNDEWLKKMLVDQSGNNFSMNDISKIHTESILESSPIIGRKHHNIADKCALNNDTEAIKLVTVGDSYCSESNVDLYQYKFLSKSEENIIGLDKQLSSDDDPCKRDSIIEELFYKQNIADSDREKEVTIRNNQKQINNNYINKFTSVKSDYEIYKSLSKEQEHKVEDNNDDFDDEDNDDGQMVNEPDDSNWYRNISSLKVFLDMLWLNPHNPSSNKSARSRSQSPNCSSDRERCRRSHDSASSFNNSSLSMSASKPPTSKLFQWNNSSKYFIEYQLPITAEDESHPNKQNYNIPKCPIRILIRPTDSTGNSNNNNGVKVFELNHAYEFPVTFNNVTVGKWWRSHVKFRLICQDYNNKESIVAVSVLPLRNVISTNNFYRLIPMRFPRTKVNKARVVIGSLAIRTTLLASKADPINHIHSKVDKRQVNVIRNIQHQDKYAPQVLSLSHRSHSRRPLHYSSQKSVPLRHTTALSTFKMHPINLVSLISVSSLRYVSTKMISGDYKSGIKSCNLYFIGRLLWAQDQKIKSRILWASSKISDSESTLDLENFKLSEKISLILTSDLLKKLKNNFAILEVWDKSMDNMKDSLYGLVKIPMNIISMSFANDHIRTTVLNNVYPLMCCDDWINIEDALTGKSKGQIHVMLAVGSHQQIDNLQLSKENTVDGHWNRNYVASGVSDNDLVEHIIEIDLESLRNIDLNLLPDFSSKESFFYVQYYFPQQQSITESNGKNCSSTIFRSVSHPTQRNVDISDLNCHKFRLPLDCSLKTFLNNNFGAMAKKNILFELYTKQYNPFPSCRSIAKGCLQISSLFQLINQHSVSVDSVANTVTQQQIPIRLVCGEDSEEVSSVGTLNICLCYKTKLLERTMKNFTSSNALSPHDQPIVNIEILSATGLQKAAESLLKVHPELEYSSVTGVNTHVKYWVTDESNKQSRINVNSKGFQKFKIHKTKTVARSFIPKYDDLNQVLLGPIIDDDDSNTLYRTLAEKILIGVYQLNVEVNHDVPKSLYCDFEENVSMSSILLAKGRISLADILLRSSGTMGPMWLTLFSPMEVNSDYGGCKLNITGKKKPDALYSLEKRKAVGAVELKLSFQDKSDRRNILQLAMDIGYVVPWTSRLETEDLVWQSLDVHGCSFKILTVTVEEVELSAKLINCVFTKETGFKKSSMKIITRYRLYKQSIASSPYFMLNDEEMMERMFIPVNHQLQYCYRVSSDLFRYFRESKLEVQVWAIYGNSVTTFGNDYESSDSPSDVRLLGSAFFDLSTLILPADVTHKTVSHILPIWKRGIPNCDSSNVTVTVDISGATSPLPSYNSDNEDNEYGSKSNGCNVTNSKMKIIGRTETDSQKSLMAHISIEKAVNLKRDTNDVDPSEKNLNYFVIFPCNDNTKSKQSTISKGVKEVTWNYECDTRIPFTLLNVKDNTLDFKLYYSTTESELEEEIRDNKALKGVVKLDLSLLLKGFERVIGWYNIVNMQGECQGQIKIGVTPLVPLVSNSAVMHLVKQPTLSKEMNALTLEDHQTYLANVRLRLHGSVNPAPSYSTNIPHNSVVGDSSQKTVCPDSLSKSCLYNTLKEKLKELDNINETFRRRVSRDEVVQTSERDSNCAIVEENPSVINKLTIFEAPNIKLLHEDLLEQDYDMERKDFVKESYVKNFEGDTYESGSDFYEDQEEKENVSKMMFLNDTGSKNHLHIQNNGCDENSLQDSISLVENFEDAKNSTCKSVSQCSMISFEELRGMNLARSDSCSSFSSNRKYSDEDKDRLIDFPDVDSPHRDLLTNNLNDSWNTERFQQVNNSQTDHETLNPKSPPKRSVIPLFFPPSVDFQEKMKSLKRNIALNSVILKTGLNHSENLDKSGNISSLRKKVELKDISDVEAQRLSKIFGIRKM